MTELSSDYLLKHSGESLYTYYDENGEKIGSGFLPKGTDTSSLVGKSVSQNTSGLWGINGQDTDVMTNISINKDTGNVKIDAPSDFFQTQSYQEQIKPVLETISQNYKLNPDYKYALLNGDEDTKSTEEWLEEIGKELPQLVSRAFAIQAIKDETKEKTGLDLTDEQVIKMSSVALEKQNDGSVIKVEDDTVQSLPESIKNMAAFKNLQGWQNGEVTYKNLMESWNRENTPDDDIIQVYNTVKDYFNKGEFTDPDEYAEMVAFSQFIEGKHPETGFWRGVWDGISDTFFNIWMGAGEFALGVLDIAEAIGKINPLVRATETATTGSSNFVRDYMMPEFDDFKTKFHTNSMRLNEAAGGFGAVLENLTPLAMQLVIGNAIGKAAASGVKTVASQLLAKTEQAATIGKGIGMTAEQVAVNALNGTNFLMRIMSSTKANAIISSAVGTLKTMQSISSVAASTADLAAQIIVDVAVTDSKLTRQLLDGNVSDEVKQYVLEQIALDAGGWTVAAGAIKAAKAAGKTDVGRVVNAAFVPRINKWAAKVGEYTDTVKTIAHRGDADYNKTKADKIRARIEATQPEGWKRNRLENRMGKAERRQQNLTIRRAERLGRKAVGEMSGQLTKDASSWNEIVRNANRIKRDMDVKFTAAHYLADRVYKGDVSAKVSQIKREYTKLSTAMDNYTQQLTRVLRAEDAAGIKRGAKAIDIGNERSLSMISEDSNEYVLGSYRLRLGEDTKVEMKKRGEGTRGVDKEIEYYKNSTQRFRNEHPELAAQLDKLGEMGMKLSAATQGARVFVGVLDDATLLERRGAPEFRRGYLRTQRAKEWETYHKRGGELRIPELRDDQHLKWGFEGDTPDKFQDITFVLFDDINQVAKQSIRKQETAALEILGEKVEVTASGEQVKMAKTVNRTKAGAVKAITRNTERFVADMDDDVFNSILQYKKAKATIGTASMKAEEQGGRVQRAMVQPPKVTRVDRNAFIRGLDTESLDNLILLDQSSPFAKAIDTEDDFQKFLAELDNKTKQYLLDIFDEQAGELFPRALSKEEQLSSLPVFNESSWVNATGKKVPTWAKKYVVKDGGQDIEDLTQIDELKRAIDRIKGKPSLRSLSPSDRIVLATDADYPGWAVSARDDGNSGLLRMLDESDPNFSREGSRRDYYRDWKGKEIAVLEMPPEKYMDEIGERGSKNVRDIVIDNPRVEEYVEKFSNGEKAPLPYIQFGKNGEVLGQEGRHRTIAASKARIDKVPVIIEYAKGTHPSLLDKYKDVTDSFVLRGDGPKSGVSRLYSSSVLSAEQGHYTLENLEKIIDNDQDFLTNLKRQYIINNKKIMDSPSVTDEIVRIKQEQAIFDAETLYAQNIRDLEKLRDEINLPGMGVDLNRQMDEIIDTFIENNAKDRAVSATFRAMDDSYELIEYATLKSLADEKTLKKISNKLEAVAEKRYIQILTENNKIVKDGKTVEKMTSGQINKAANSWARQTKDWFEERVNQRYGRATTRLREIDPENVDFDDLFAKVDAINAEITKSSKASDVVKTYDDAGREEYVRLSPTVANLITTMPTPMRRGAWGTIQDDFVKVFRMGTTGGLVPASLFRQGIRDPGLAYTVTGATRTSAEVRRQLNMVYGPTVASYYEQSAPDLWASLLEQGGGDAVKAAGLAVEQEMSRGGTHIADEMQSQLYRLNRQAKMARTEGGVYDEQVFETIGAKAEDALMKTEKLNNMRESKIRIWVYHNAFLDAMNNGHSIPMARRYAEMMQAESITNFSRQTYHLANLTHTVPYLGAAINGFKSFWRLYALDPVGVTTRLVTGYVVPLIALTTLSLGDEENKRVYKQIPEYEKDDNFVFVINGQKFSIPIPQEVSTLVRPIQSWIEIMAGANDHSMEELMANNLAGFFPLDFQGFVNVDSDRILANNEQEDVFMDHLLPGFSALSSSMMGPLAKSGVILVTGHDPYTRKKIDTSYNLTDPVTGEPIVVDYKSGEMAKGIANIFQGNFGVSAPMAQAIFNNLFGTNNMMIIDGLSSIAASVPTDEGIGAGLTKAAEKVSENIGKPFVIGNYGEESNQAWKRATRILYADKTALMSDKEYIADLKLLNSGEGTEEANNKALSRIRTKQEQFQLKVLNATKNLVNEYDGGTLDRAKFATVLSLMTFKEGNNQDPQSPLSSLYDDQEYKLARAQAIETMAKLGFDSPNDKSIFGYYGINKDTGEIGFQFYSPLAILDFERSSTLQDDVSYANIKAMVDESGLWDAHDSMKAQTQAIYNKGKLSKQDYANIDAIIINWNSQVAKTIAPYVSKMAPEAAINNKQVRDYLYPLIEVPGEWEVDNRGKRVYLGDRGNKKAAYYESWLKSMYGINDKYKGQY